MRSAARSPRVERVSPRVRLAAALRGGDAPDEHAVVAAATVRELIDVLDRARPGLRDYVLDHAGGLQRFVNIFRNDEDISYLDGLETSLSPDDEVCLIPAIAGG